MHQAKVRELIANLEGNVARIEKLASGDANTAASADLRTSWAALVEHLAVGPAPAVRKCPSCKREIMRDATRCIHCWAKSAPPTT